MRLTLRRLLAYLDDILEPADQEAIRKKIDDSEFATDLLHRTRDTMRRLRLGAPPVLGGDGGLDPNTVAEYLDHALTQDQVEDFERVCLESDVHLAEAGACHQILTMVLGDPAEVDPEARKRMYTISSPTEPPVQRRIEPAHAVSEHPAGVVEHVSTETTTPSVIATSVVTATAPTSIEPEAPPIAPRHSAVPDYLRQTFMQRHGGKLAVAAMLLVAVVGYFLWPSDVTPVPKEVASATNAAAPPVIEGEKTAGASSDAATNGDDPKDFGDSGDSDAPPFVPGGAAEAPAGGDADAGVLEEDEVFETAPPVEFAEDDTTDGELGVTPPPLVDLTAPATSNAAANETEETRDDSSPVASLPGLPGPSNATTDDGDATVPAGAPMTPEGAPVASNPKAGAAPVIPPPRSEVDEDGPDGAAVATTDAAADDPAVPVVEPAEDAKPRVVGTYLPGADVLLRFDPSGGQWIRLAKGATVVNGDTLLAIPACRPTIALTSGVHVQLDGGTRIIVFGEAADGATGESTGGNDAPSTVGMEIVYGRAMLLSTIPTGAPLALRVGDEQADIFLPGTATLAVEVRRELPPGADPLTTPAIVTADFYATSGNVHYESKTDETAAGGFDAAPLTTWTASSAGLTIPMPYKEEPNWVRGSTASPLERGRGMAAVSAALAPGEPIDLRLSELVDHRQEEVKGLAGRVSVHVGHFEPFVAALNDSDQRNVWPEYIPTLKNALALGPEVAEQVHAAFRRQKGTADGDALFAMLVGYAPEDVDTILLRELIQKLDHESLDFRVLAIYNLTAVTNEGDLGYRPNYPVDRRERHVKKWKQRLDDGELTNGPK